MTRPRLAWFTPIPPVRSGIAAYSAEILPRLGRHFTVDVFVDVPPVPAARDSDVRGGASGSPLAGMARLDGVASLASAHDFIPRHTIRPFDLVVYQLGNAACHDYMWPYLLRYPGLVVLHDAALHHSRARALLARRREDDYRTELRYAHPAAPAALAEFAVAGFPGSPYYLWPMTRVPVSAARLVAVHSHGLAVLLREAHPEAEIRVIEMGVAEVPPPPPPDGTRPGPVFGCFGLVTPEKRIPQVLRAFASIGREFPAARLRLVGETAGHYDVAADIRRFGLADRVEVTGFVSDDELPSLIAATDVCVCLRWPTGRETSASWLRCLAAGRPTVVTDLVHTTGLPILDPRTWALSHARTEAAAADAPPSPRDAVAVGIDILDEDHSLALAIRRLASDVPLRAQLGRNARAWWAGHHTLERMAVRYREVVTEAIARPMRAPIADWPPHLLEDGTRLLRRITADAGVPSPWPPP